MSSSALGTAAPANFKGENYVYSAIRLVTRAYGASKCWPYEYMHSQWAQEQLLPDDLVRDVRSGRC